jgi:hypothetical protein
VAPSGHNREAGANPGRTRRCERGRTLHASHCVIKHYEGIREGAGSRESRKSENLPNIPENLVETVNPQADIHWLGDFFIPRPRL